MPNIDHLEKKPFATSRANLLNVRREEILYREDIKTSFGYAIAGITVSLAIAGGVYVIAATKISDPVTNDPDPVTKFHQRQAKTEQLNNHANLKENLETKTTEFKNLLKENIAYGQKTQRALVAIALDIQSLLNMKKLLQKILAQAKDEIDEMAAVQAFEVSYELA
ncbi:2321_t:CDS:2 [Entrophospora sp. SA101]|nr:10758_t:CDS:2 [Entrophospora sp. SA101]CAJ0749816.1 2321_t:CDS:2 [Entrophospora sp. SA101]CAJ0924522.1 16480_t:CDS:2 [Entrophospora sp. SA101]